MNRIVLKVTISGKSAKEAFKVDENDIRTYLEDEFGYSNSDVLVEITEETDKL